MKTKLFAICLTLSLLISGCGSGQPSGSTIPPTPQGPDLVYFNNIVSVKTGLDIASSEAYIFSRSMTVTPNVTTLAQLQEQLPKGMVPEITESGGIHFYTFTFSDGSKIILELVLKNG